MRPTLLATAELRYLRHEVGSAAMQYARCGAGKFIAHSNLGLCYAALGEDAQALLNHRQAFRRGIDNRGLMRDACNAIGLHRCRVACARAHTHAACRVHACDRCECVELGCYCMRALDHSSRTDTRSGAD